MARPSPTPALDALRPQHRRFVAEYLACGEGTTAVLAAGYSPNGARQAASRLLTRVDVQAALRESQQEIVDKLRITADDIAREAWAIALDPDTPAGARVQALALLAKRHPEYSDKHHIVSDQRVRVEALHAVASLTTDQLRQLAAGIE